MRLDPKYVEMERAAVVRGVEDWMDNVVGLFERAAREAGSYKARFLEAVEETLAGKANATKPEDVLSWLINGVSTPFNNMRLDMAVTHGGRLAEAFRRVKELAKQETAAADAARPKTHMLTGVRTVLPTLKSARDHASRSRPPVLIHVGTVESCYERAKKLNGGRMNCTIEEWSYNVPVVVTSEWTYHVTSMVSPDDYEM